NKGEKMSKTVGNVVDPFDLVKAYGREQLRYFFLREVMWGQDGNYSPEAIANRINADLANNLGNLAQRSLSMIYKNCEGKLPTPRNFSEADNALLAATDALYAQAREAMNRQAITSYLDAVWGVIAQANRYFAAEEPWAKKKTDPERMETVLYVTAECVRQFAILASPVMPESCAKLLDQLAVPPDRRAFVHLGETGRLVAGTAISEPEGVFPRYVDPAEEAAKSAGSSAEQQRQAKAAKEAKRAAEREKAKREAQAKAEGKKT
ncbi:MAG: class I tRNA ligase family protein, partial [Hyphomicrobiaceae bacterium]|nr:class I tRNA ligase family protein [Hyphomicrobiaceae bacterium]